MADAINYIEIERTVSLDGPILPEALPGTFYQSEREAHKFVISATRGRQPVALTGAVTGRCIRRADGGTVELQGEIVDGSAVLALEQACYAQPGWIALTIYVTDGDVKTAVYSAVTTVTLTTTETIIDPGHVVPDVDDVIAMMGEAEAAIDAANAAAASATAAAQHAVRYDEAQTLTDAQQATARGNISAVSQAEQAEALKEKADAIIENVSGTGTVQAQNAVGGAPVSLDVQVAATVTEGSPTPDSPITITGATSASVALGPQTISQDMTALVGAQGVGIGVWQPLEGKLTESARLFAVTADDVTEVGTASGGQPYASVTLPVRGSGTGAALVCSHYPIVPGAAALGIRCGNERVAFVYDARFTDLETAKSIIGAMNMQLEYILYTEAEYTTPVQTLTLDPGGNALTVTGGVLMMRYAVDTRAYIDTVDSQLSARIDTLDTKTAADLAAAILIREQIDNRVYPGRDLTVLFADEIAGYSDEWAWIKARIVAGDYSGINVNDYIPVTFAGTSLVNPMRIMGIDTYYDSGPSPAVGHHIDFISTRPWISPAPMNLVVTNVGLGDPATVWTSTNMYHYLNSLAGEVPNNTAIPVETTTVDYTADGVYYKLPQKIKDVIVDKYMYLVERKPSGTTRPTANTGVNYLSAGKVWLPTEFEVCGAVYGGDDKHSLAMAVQYPLFAHSISNRIKYYSGSRQVWMTMTPDGSSATNFIGISDAGRVAAYSAALSRRPPVCFRVGASE